MDPGTSRSDERADNGDAGGVPPAAAWAVVVSLCLFAAFRSRPMPLGLLGALGLLAAAACLAGGTIRAVRGGGAVFALNRPRFPAVAWLAAAVGLGAGLSVAYRIHANLAPWPSAVGWFAGWAAAIGAVEELVYRGFVLTGLRGGGRFPAVVLAAAGHTAYKHLLFIGRAETLSTELGFLAAATFLVGLLLGALRESSRSLWPPLLGHAAFDVVLYGALSQAPWWVWG